MTADLGGISIWGMADEPSPAIAVDGSAVAAPLRKKKKKTKVKIIVNLSACK